MPVLLWQGQLPTCPPMNWRTPPCLCIFPRSLRARQTASGSTNGGAVSNILSHLQALEAESIHIFREVFAEFRNPVMLWSMGKDSSVLLRLAEKAFYPARIPFPLMHVDTGTKFPEMYTFRDELAEELGFKLIVEQNTEALANAPKMCNVARYCNFCSKNLKTEGLLGAIEKHGFDAAIGGARREEE